MSRYGNVYFNNHDDLYIPANPPAFVPSRLDYREGDKTLREPSNRTEPTYEFDEPAKQLTVNCYRAAIDWQELIRRVKEIRLRYRGELLILLRVSQDTAREQMSSLVHHQFDRSGSHGILLEFSRTLSALKDAA
jgi:hypothetical protein